MSHKNVANIVSLTRFFSQGRQDFFQESGCLHSDLQIENERLQLQDCWEEAAALWLIASGPNLLPSSSDWHSVDKPEFNMHYLQ